jgi:oxygen-dependent protoporphyrinogen oxidase
VSGSVVVIGGGITGLAAAYALEAATPSGVLDTVMLLEADAPLGGKIVTERIEGFVIEGGPDSFFTLKPQALQFCRALGLEDQLVGTRAPRHVFVLHRGVLEPLPDGLATLVPTRLLPFVRSGLFSWPEKVRMVGEVLVPPHANGSDEAVGEFVRRRLGRAAVDRLAAPLLAGIYAGDIERQSLQATFPQLAEMESQHGSLVAATLRRRFARRRSGQVREREESVQRKESDGLGTFATLRNGLDRLVDRAASSLRHVAVQTGSRVLAVGQVGHQYRVYLADGAWIGADSVIVTTPAFAAAQLLRDLCPAAASALTQIPYVSTAAISLGFRREDVVHPLAGHGYVVARGEGLAHTACTWMSSKWAGRAPAGSVLLRCYAGRAGDQRALEGDDEHLVRTVLGELRPVLGISGQPLLVRVHRWQDAMPQYEVGHLARVTAVTDALRQTPGMLVAGAGYGGVGLPDCIRQGTEAAAAALAHLRTVGQGEGADASRA